MCGKIAEGEWQKELASSEARSKKLCLRMNSILGPKDHPQGLRFNSDMADLNPCPACRHSFVVFVHMQKQLSALKRDHESAYQVKLRTWRLTKKTKGEPRCSGITVQEYVCCCYLLHSQGQTSGGSCLIDRLLVVPSPLAPPAIVGAPLVLSRTMSCRTSVAPLLKRSGAGRSPPARQLSRAPRKSSGTSSPWPRSWAVAIFRQMATTPPTATVCRVQLPST